MKFVAVALILYFNVICCLSDTTPKTSNVKDIIDVNGSNETIPNPTLITDKPDPSTSVSPNSTTVKPTTPTTPNNTTPIPTPTPPPNPPPTTTIKPNSTTTEPPTPAPNTTTTVPPTPAPNTTTTVSPTPPPNTTTTVLPPTTKPSTITTQAPLTTTAIPDHQRRFDGPSFVGGIVLALGLVAIGFVAFKFYKARTELNYHTL